MKKTRETHVKKDLFDIAVKALWEEIQYQDGLERRTDCEAKDPPGFLTLLRVYLRKAEQEWAMKPGDEPSLHEIRKIAAIAIRAMVYCGIHPRTHLT